MGLGLRVAWLQLFAALYLGISFVDPHLVIVAIRGLAFRVEGCFKITSCSPFREMAPSNNLFLSLGP